MSIQKRTVYYDVVDGIYRFSDWAHVTTTLGGMAEPFLVYNRFNPNADFEQYDATDMMVRVDEMKRWDDNKSQFILSGNSDQVLHGGTPLPRDGR